jgi:hypothetical protein
MSSTCNVINVNQIKVSDLVRYQSLTTKDFILTIESGSSNKLYSRRTTFGDIKNFLSNLTSSFTGSFSGSSKLIGKFTGSFKGGFTGSFLGKSTGSYSGSLFIKNETSSANYFDLVFAAGPGQQGLKVDQGQIFYDPSNNTLTVDTDIYAGNAFDVIVNTNPSLFATPNSITLGSSATSLIIGNNGASSYTKFLTKQVRGNFTGSFTGSFSGSTLGNLISKNAKLSGSFSGSYFGKLLSKKANLTGSLTGSLKGFISASAAFKNKPAFYGTSSWSKNSDHAIESDISYGNPFGTGTSNYYANWFNSTTIADSNILNLDNNVSFLKAVKLQTGTSKTTLFFISSSKSNTVGFGLQPYKTYFRTAQSDAYSNGFAWYCGGTPSATLSSPFLEPGEKGTTILATLYDNLGVGNFDTIENINSLFHIHLTGSKLQYPKNNWVNPNATVVSRLDTALKNPLRITSGSNPAISTTVVSSNQGAILLNLSSSGQLDVKGDIVAFSTYGSSDERLKTNIQEINCACDKISKLKPVSFTWKQTNIDDMGLIAQNVEKEFPHLVKEDLGGYKVVKYNSLIALLIKSIQELKSEITELKDRIK